MMQFLVLKLMRYCSKYRSSILSEFRGHVLQLLLHREAGQVISDSFELYANTAEKSLLLREFYGKEVVSFIPQQEGTKNDLRTILEGLEADRQRRILAATKDNIQHMCVSVHFCVNTCPWANSTPASRIQTKVPCLTPLYTVYFGNMSLNWNYFKTEQKQTVFAVRLSTCAWTPLPKSYTRDTVLSWHGIF